MALRLRFLFAQPRSQGPAGERTNAKLCFAGSRIGVEALIVVHEAELRGSGFAKRELGNQGGLLCFAEPPIGMEASIVVHEAELRGSGFAKRELGNQGARGSQRDQGEALFRDAWLGNTIREKGSPNL
jgi:hypothetical protein